MRARTRRQSRGGVGARRRGGAADATPAQRHGGGHPQLRAPPGKEEVMTKLESMYDVIIIGGSYAGLAATLQLARARRSVLILDAAQRRNRFVSHAHGFLGQDGQA